MDDNLLKSLLYRSEDPSVDYKSEQYVFSKNDVPEQGLSKPERAKLLEEEKSELLKDVLAMANAWSDGPRYILLGFTENKPASPTVVGIDSNRLHDDAAFQQFIGSKVNNPLQFKYEVQEFGGLPVGIITIAKQRRPFYAKESYGVVEKHVVYVRRGSSTAIADPGEIATMGAAENDHRAEADVAVHFLDKTGAVITGSSRDVRVPMFASEDLPNFEESRSEGPFGLLSGISGKTANPNYWRELRGFAETCRRAIPVQISLINRSEFPLTHCELLVNAKLGGNDVLLQEGDDSPRPPRAYREFVDIASRINIRSLAAKSRVDVNCESGHHVAIATFDRILPGKTVRASELFSFLPAQSGTMTVHCTLFANELKEPRQFVETFEVKASDEPWDFEMLVKLNSFLSQ